MGRFFGPTPNIISGDGFFRGSAAPAVGWHFTSRGAPVADAAQFSAYGNGAHVAVAGNTLYRSTNDGVSWTQVDANIRAYGSVLYAGGGVWGVAVQNANTIYRSTDNGVTWGAVAAPRSSYGLASNGAGTWVLGGGSGQGVGTAFYARSTDNGLTWSEPGLTSTGTFFRIIWDGVKFVASCRTAASSGNNAGVAVSTDLGQTWTQTQLSAVNNYIFGLNYDPTLQVYCVVTNDQDTIRIASNPANLATAADTPTSLSDGGSNFAQMGVHGGGGIIFVFGVAGGVARSLNSGGTFTTGTLNFSPSSDSAECCSYDGVSEIFVAAGQGGNVATYP